MTDALRCLSSDSTGVSVRCIPEDLEYAKIALTSLERGFPRILNSLGADEPFPVLAVLVPDRGEFDRLVRDFLQVEIEVPSHPARIAQAQRDCMVLLSPRVYHSQSTFTYDPRLFSLMCLHELVHIVEEALSPAIEASPLWWGEGLAVSLSGQWKEDPTFFGEVRRSLSNGSIPPLETTLSGRDGAYHWGWTVVRCIEDSFGMRTVARLVRECADGDVLSLLPVDLPCFSSLWRGWLQEYRAGFA